MSLVVFYDENVRLNTTVKVGFVTISSDSESVSCSSVSSLSVSSSSLSVVSSHYLPETDGGWKHFNCLRRAALNWSSILSVFSKSSCSVSTLVSSHRRRYPDSLSQTRYITALRLQIANSGELLTDKMDWYELVDGATGVNMILLCFNEILRTRHYLSLVQTLETSLIRFHWFQPHSRDSLNYQQTQCL